jgi:UDP-N-acetylmuramoyl-L-alanyl-D-glutamate--2,6-diaminopimelate ligase
MMISDIIKKYQFTGIESDSRLVKTGTAFVSTSKSDSLLHCQQAIEKGASIIIAKQAIKDNLNLNNSLFIHSENPSLDLANLAADYYAPLPETNVAITGTNGKSSVASIVRQLWEYLGKNSASIGTVGIETNVMLDNSSLESIPSLTTLDSLSFFKVLSALKKANVNHVIFEASSIGIDQYRCYGLPLQAAGFTNLTQDHLDYHGDMETYFLAKSKLFSEILEPEKTAVLNCDSDYAQRLQAIAKSRSQQIITYGIDNQYADLNASITAISGHSIVFDLNAYGKLHKDLELPLAGSFQVENLLCALGLLIASGFTLEQLLNCLPLLKSVKGRMEYVTTINQADIFVDYAHTPDALERALISLRKHTNNNLCVLFGCGGNRDASKRPIMGKFACLHSDHVIVTDDNPRFEDAANIRKEILSNCDFKALEVADRKQAILYAIKNLKKGDTLLVAGKGHETGQIIAGTTIPFDDSSEIKAAVMEYAK